MARKSMQEKQRVRNVLFAIWQVLCICLFIVIGVNIATRLSQIEAAVWDDSDTNEEIAEESTELEEVAWSKLTQSETMANDNAQIEEFGNISEYARTCEIGEIEKPMKRARAKSLAKLQELTELNDKIAAILEDAHLYPDNILEALASNPEMTDFVSNYLNEEQTTSMRLTEEEKNMKYPLFLQWDPRWGYNYYGDDSNIGLAGCGPTSLSMALYYLTGNEELTPDKIAAYAMENDYYMYGTGTLWALMEDVPIQYGVKVDLPEISEDSMKQKLDDGNILICAMRPGDFTAAGHFIVIYGYEEEGFLINDPNCVARSKEAWNFEQIEDQIKKVWSLAG